MKAITISTENSETYSSISNFFIDYYMTEANGEFVKVYLYLVRLLSLNRDISVAEIADHFNLTENDICRAIKYWVGKDVIKFSYDGKGNLVGIVLLPLKSQASEVKKANDAFSMLRDMSKETNGEPSTKSADVAPVIKKVVDNKEELPIDMPIPAKMAYSPAAKEKLSMDRDWEDIFYHVETVFGVTFSEADLESLMYVYNELKFNVDLYDYLIDYCVEMGKKSCKYLEAVAIAWYKDGIKTKQDAKEQVGTTSKICRIVFKSLGVRRSNPTTAEIAYFKTWNKDYGFNEKMIQLACDKAITSKPQSANYAYVNGILENWHKNGIKTPEDVYIHDKKFMAANIHGSLSKPNNVSHINNFKQTKLDSQLDEMEALFLKEVNS